MLTVTTSADEAAARVFAAQHGVISGAQAMRAGLTRRQIEGRVASKRWTSRARDVYVLPGTPDTWRQRAMVASLATARAGGVISHMTAGAVFGLMAPSPLPHVTVPPGRSQRCGVAKVHRAVLSPQDRLHREEMWVVSPSRVLVDLAPLLGRAELEEVCDGVLCGGMASVDSTLASLDRAGGHRRGHALLRSVLEVWTPEIEPGSVAEVRLLRLLSELGVDDLVTQHEVRTSEGRLIARLDLARPAVRKGLEYDSVRHHNPRRWLHDEGRYGSLAAAGWAVQGVTKADLIPGEPRLRGLASWLGVVDCVHG